MMTDDAVIAALISGAAVVIAVAMPLWLNRKKVRDKEHVDEIIADSNERMKLRNELRDEIATLRGRIQVSERRIEECSAEKEEYKATMLRYASELKMSAEYTTRLEECVRRYEKLIDTLAAKLGEST
jgi:predicted RNase H-like nuclease (RuvC/YqgF family)